jgi:hypothetical protein
LGKESESVIALFYSKARNKEPDNYTYGGKIQEEMDMDHVLLPKYPAWHVPRYPGDPKL